MNSDSENDSLNTDIVFPIENLSIQNDQEQKTTNKDEDLMIVKQSSQTTSNSTSTVNNKSSSKKNGDSCKKSKKKDKQTSQVATLAIQQQPVSKEKTNNTLTGNSSITNQQASTIVQQTDVISKQPSKSKNNQTTKIKDQDLIDIDCFLDEDMFEQKKTEFQQYEQKVKNIDVNNEQYDPHQHGTNEAYHQNHPHEKYDYKENILLINEFEQMMVNNAQEFCDKLGFKTDQSSKNRLVKCVSIFGNTGEGKSHTMNHTFFDGKEVFKTSQAQNSCTIGIWAAYNPQWNLIAIDTEGLLGVTENNNRRTRLLLKVLAISDVIIYRTRAERLHNDLFTFLGDASRAYVHHFSNELKAAALRCNFSCPLSDLGCVVVIFHETHHTDILTKDENKEPEDVLRLRFQSMNLSTEAYSAMEYVGTRTSKNPTSFDKLQACLKKHLNNSTVRSARHPFVIFNSLKLLNEKFSGEIDKSVPNTFPDQYFVCKFVCLSCNARCTKSMNHERDGIPHHSPINCKYQHQFNNQIFYCQDCFNRGENKIVIPKVTSSKDQSWLGLVNYAWSGYILECKQCGIIYRSRQFWFGNKNPEETCIRTQIHHVWPGEIGICQGTQNAAQRVVDGVTYLTEAVSSISAKPTKIVSSWVADQIAPTYWVPNFKITNCGICNKEFEELDQKHHCRACGGGFCESCSSKTRPVPERGWGDEPVRVCDNCYETVIESNNTEITARKVGEALQSTIGTVVSAIDYPLEWFKDSARPEYWIPDKDCINCILCKREFNDKIPIHHCRACGNGVCDNCSLKRKPVPNRGWDHPVRVCNDCNSKGNIVGEVPCV